MTEIVNHTSTFNLEGANPIKGYDGASFPVNGVREDYMIKATTYNGYGGYLDKIKTPEAIKKRTNTRTRKHQPRNRRKRTTRPICKERFAKCKTYSKWTWTSIWIW